MALQLFRRCDAICGSSNRCAVKLYPVCPKCLNRQEVPRYKNPSSSRFCHLKFCLTRLAPVVYAINTSIVQTIDKSPYEVVFGQKPRSDFEIWSVLSKDGIEDEEQLPNNFIDTLNGCRTIDDTSNTPSHNDPEINAAIDTIDEAITTTSTIFNLIKDLPARSPQLT
ncbi:unnamed protein product, partial [Didymodactylos carnosus]